MTSRDLIPTQRALCLTAVLSGAFGVGLTISMATPLVSLTLERMGHSTFVVGVAAAIYAGAILLIGPFIPALIHRLGPVPALALGTALSALALLSIPFTAALGLILALRFAMGIGNALEWVVSETWINALPAEGSRGRVVGLYATVWGAGIAGGPLLLTLIGTEGALPFLIAAGILAAALVPLLLARRLAPRLEKPAARGALRSAFRAAPLAVSAAFLCGVGEGSVFSLFPIYGLASGFDSAAAVLLTSVFSAGAIALQAPIGWMADRMDRGRVLAIVALLSALCIALVAPALELPFAVWPVLFIWGGSVAAFYTLGLILLGERFQDGDLASANTVYILAYTIGMIVGPLVSGGAMRLWHPHGLLLALGAASLLYALAVSRRGTGRAAAPSAAEG